MPQYLSDRRLYFDRFLQTYNPGPPLQLARFVLLPLRALFPTLVLRALVSNSPLLWCVDFLGWGSHAYFWAGGRHCPAFSRQIAVGVANFFA